MQKLVHMNTKFRNNYYNTSCCDFTYKFPQVIKNIIKMRLYSIDIPNSWYNISNYIGNTNFFIKIKKRQKNSERIVETKYEIEIPEGRWTKEELANHINRKYFYLSGSKTDLYFFKVYVDLTTSTTTFELQYPSTEDYTDAKFDLIFSGDDFIKNQTKRPIIANLGWTLGYRQAQYINIMNKISSEAFFDDSQNRYIFISINDYKYSRNDNNIAFLQDSVLDRDVLGKIYMKRNKFHISINDTDGKENLKERKYFSPVNIDKISLKLLDENGNIINLNNMDYSFTLEFIIEN